LRYQAQCDLALDQTLANIGLSKLTNLPNGEGEFIRVCDDGKAWLYVLRKRGPQLCFTSTRYTDGMTAESVSTAGKMKHWAERRQFIEKSLALGRVFALR
jgi:hypothetical protein